MHCKYLFVIFLFLYAEVSISDTQGWDCRQLKSGEWDCGAKVMLPVTEDLKKDQPSKNIDEPEPPIAVIKNPITPGIEVAVSEPPKASTEELKFNCKSNGAGPDETKSCRSVSERDYAISEQNDTPSSSFFAAAFNTKEESIFRTLHNQLKVDPWENCTRSSQEKQTIYDVNDIRKAAPMYISSDYSEVFDKEMTSFSGNVDIVRADQHVLSDKASYNTNSGTMDAQGRVFYNENQMSLYSDTALLKLNSDEARLREALFISPDGPLRGKAGVVYRDNKFLSRFKDAAFTSCRPGNQDWVVHADRLKMNQQTGKAAAKNAWLEFKGIPVLYTPYISFPLDDRRISGVLPPSFSATGDNGFDITIPYYWNIAPNYDLTVWPRYMAKRGPMLGGEFRYLSEKTESSLALEYLPHDKIRKEQRYAGSLKNESTFLDNWSTYIDINYVSDKEYFDELNDTLGLSNDRFLRSIADLSYATDAVNFSTRLETYQTIDKRIADESKPYQKFPQANLNLQHSFDQLPINVAMENEYINFYRKGRVSGQRFNTKSSIEMPIETAGSFINPRFSLQHSNYFLSDQKAGDPSNISRTLPIVSLDSGLFFEKDINLAGSKYLHTIEPRLFYLYIPKSNQKDIPIFDSSLYDFGFSSLFRENRFSGTDRIQDANQVTFAMTTTLMDSETGLERMNLSVGEIFYFKDREVTLTGSPETSNFSNVVAELSGQLTDHLSYKSALQWNPDRNDFTRGQAELRYNNRDGKLLNIGYRYRKDDQNLNIKDNQYIIQTDASVRWPIYDNWYGVGRWQYSLKFNSTKESFIGLEKESCCWRFRILWRRYANSISGNSKDEMETGIFAQIEFKGLTGFGKKIDVFLEENLRGYQRP